MEVHLIARDAFEGVRERMPEIQNFAQARFMLILGNDARFLRDRALDHKSESGALTAQNFFQSLFEKSEKLGVSDHSVLDDFVDSRAKFAGRQTAEECGIGHHSFRRVKRAHKVLPFRKIDASLSSDRAID